MADSAQVAEGFFDAWTSKDFERARGLLHDDVSFEGPIDTFSDADSYLASLRQLSAIVTGLRARPVGRQPLRIAPPVPWAVRSKLDHGLAKPANKVT